MFTPIILLLTVTCARGVYPPDRITFENEQQNDQQYQPQQPNNYQQQERVVEKREAAASPTLAPQWGFIPLISGAGLGWGAPPPVIQVHHIVQIQSPNQRCIPIPGPMPTPTPGGYPPSRPGGQDGIESRFGETNNTTVKNPSPCVWAIVSCCSPGNANIRYSCFELLGCQGAFWDLSPCEPRVVQAAANTALMFYMSATPVNNQSNVIDFDAPESASAL